MNADPTLILALAVNLLGLVWGASSIASSVKTLGTAVGRLSTTMDEDRKVQQQLVTELALLRQSRENDVIRIRRLEIRVFDHPEDGE